MAQTQSSSPDGCCVVAGCLTLQYSTYAPVATSGLWGLHEDSPLQESHPLESDILRSRRQPKAQKTAEQKSDERSLLESARRPRCCQPYLRIESTYPEIPSLPHSPVATNRPLALILQRLFDSSSSLDAASR